MKKFLAGVSILFLASCGRYLSPIAPQELAPEKVKQLTATADASGVSFAWSSSTRDVRGKKLKSLEGYRIYRKEIDPAENEILSFDGWDQVAFIEDKHLAELLRRQEEARASGGIVRKVSAPDELKHFSFTDKDIKNGTIYAYRIIAVNQGGVESEDEQMVQVTYLGNDSIVDRFTLDD
ncbi:MAG: hypothetical protein H6619_05760 [Deltaproteobacteria bacterium]|nr:hypothetical protein [Deltaproteobacteria bacterium]